MPLGNVTDPVNYWAFPSITRTAGGDLLVVGYGAPDHVGPSGDLYTRRSDDGTGDLPTWTMWTKIRDVVADCRDPGITTLSNGRIVLAYTETDNSSFFFNATFFQARTMYSDDDGVSWSAPVDVPLPPGIAFSVSNSVPIELPDGTLILPVYGAPAVSAASPISAFVAASTDGGATWSHRATIASSDLGRIWDEPYLLLLADGETILCAIRSDRPTSANPDGSENDYLIHICKSADAGFTWTAPQSLFVGSGRPAMALDASGDVVLMQYRERLPGIASLYRAIDPVTLEYGSPVNLAGGSTAAMVYGGWCQRASDKRLCAAFAIEASPTMMFFQVVDTPTQGTLWIPPPEPPEPPPEPPEPPPEPTPSNGSLGGLRLGRIRL